MPSIQQRSVFYSQNFLKNPCLIDQLLDTYNLRPEDTIYEIGPGKGIITERLAQRCHQVVAIEKDPCLVELLHRRFAHIPNITIHEGDFLQFRLPISHYKVFASIPFNITTAIVTRLTTTPVPPDESYLVMQKEAADKFLGRPKASLYAILIKPEFELNIVHHFKRTDFAPAPRVDVVMLRLRKRGPPLIQHSEIQLFRDFVVYNFTSWQPSLRTTLKGLFTPQQLKHIAKNLDFDLDATPTSVHFDQWLTLFHFFKHVSTIQAIQIISGSEKRLKRQQAQLQKIHQTRIRP